MLYFQPFSEENLTPKRVVFDRPRSRRERLEASVGNQSHELQESLKDLGIQVTEEQTRESLENLRSGVDLQQAAQEQEAREVNELIRIADQERGLDQAEVRERFMNDVQQRLAVVLAILVNDGELSEAQLSPATLSATLAQLESQKGNLKVTSHNGERNLYVHEQSLLGVPSKLSQHANADVKAAWENVTRNLVNNVRLMRAAAAAIAEQEEEPTWADDAKELYQNVVEEWKNLPPVAKAASIAAGAIGSLWFLNKIFNRGSNSGPFSKMLGIGVLIASGVYVAGKFMSLDKAFETLGAGFEKLKQADFVKGMQAFMNGDTDAAKRHLGEAYETIRARWLGERTPESETRETEGERPEMIPANEALWNYAKDLKVALFPITNVLKNNPETTTVILMYLSANHHSALISGFSFTADNALAFAKLAVTAPLHPIRGLMIITAFLAAKEAGERLELPRNTRQLRTYLREMFQEKRDEISKFIEDNGLGEDLHAEQIEESTKYLTGEKNVMELQPKALELVEDVVDNSIDFLRLSQPEKEALRSRVGLRNLKDQLINIRLYEEGLSEDLKMKTQELVTHLEELLRNMRGRNITPDELNILLEKARTAEVGIKKEGGTLFWGYTHNGRFLDEDHLMGLGIDPEASEDERVRAATSFVVDQSSAGQVLSQAVFRTGLERGRETIAGAIDLVKNGNGLVLWDGLKAVVVDLATNSFYEIPRSLFNIFCAKLEGDEHAIDVGYKEFTFAYAGGLASYMVIGGKRALNPWRFVRLWQAAGWRGLITPVYETAFYPITVANRAQSVINSRIWQPLRYGSTQGRTGLIGLMGESSARRWNSIKSMNIFSENRAMYKELSKLHEALGKARTAQTRALEAFSRNETAGMVEEIRNLIKNFGGELEDIAKALSNTDMEHNVRLLQGAITARNETFALHASMEEIRRVVNFGKKLESEHFLKLRQIASNSVLGEQLKSFLANLDNMNAGKADEVMELLSDVKNLPQAAQKLQEFGLLSSADEAMKAVNEAEDAIRTAVSTGEAIDAARTGARSISEILELAKRGGDLSLEEMARLRQMPVDELKNLLKGMEMSDDAAGRLANAITKGNPDDLVRIMRETGFFEQARDTARAAAEVAEAGRASAHLNEALETIRSGRAITIQQLEALREAAQAENFKDTLRAAGVASEHLDEVARLLREERNLGRLAEGLEATRFIKVGQGIRGILRIGNILPAVGMAVGVVASIMDAREAWALEEEFKNNEELREIYNNKGWVHAGAGALMMVVDGFAIAGSIAAIPVMVIMAGIMAAGRMVTGTMDAQARLAMRREDYMTTARAHGREKLLHEWFVTGQDLGADEMYDSAIDVPGSDQITVYKAQRAGTRRKLIEALISIEDEQVDPYRMKYIEATTELLNVQSFKHAEDLLVQSKVFANVMKVRNQTLTIPGPNPQTLNLSESRFDANQITYADVRAIFSAVMGQNANTLREIFGNNENRERANKLFGRLNGLDPNYINHVISVLYKYSFANENTSASDRERWSRFADELVVYLQFNNHRFTPEVVENPEAEISNIERIFFDENLPADQLESLKEGFSAPTKGIAALYELAKFYGYSGNPNIARLQRFFDENHAPMYGVYWNGSEWKTNDKNGHDESHGSDPDLAVPSIIQELKDDPSDVLESYLDSSLQLRSRDDEEKRLHQVNSMRSILESTFSAFTPVEVSRGEVSYVEQSPTAAMASSLAADAQSGFDTMADAIYGDTTGLRMAGEEALDRIRNLGGDIADIAGVTRGRIASVLSGVTRSRQ